MSGHIRRSGKSSWELKFNVAGKTQYRSFKGTKREAAAEMVRQIARSKGYIDVDADRRGQNLAHATSITHKWLSLARDVIEPTCFLYRHYDAKGDLLYVGMSLNVGRGK